MSQLPYPWLASVVTLFPEMFPGPLGHSLAGRALEEGRWRLETIGLRDFATDRHRTVDDVPFGGGAGMVMRPDVVARAIDAARAQGPERPALFLTPRGRPLTQGRVAALAAGSGTRDLMRPLRRGRPTRHRGARAGRAVFGRHRAVGWRAGGDRPDRCMRPPAPGRGRGAGVAERGEFRGRPAGISPLHPTAGLGGTRCPGGVGLGSSRAHPCLAAGSTPSVSPGAGAPTCGRAICKASRAIARPWSAVGPTRNEVVP